MEKGEQETEGAHGGGSWMEEGQLTQQAAIPPIVSSAPHWLRQDRLAGLPVSRHLILLLNYMDDKGHPTPGPPVSHRSVLTLEMTGVCGVEEKEEKEEEEEELLLSPSPLFLHVSRPNPQR
ncbi:unnamed protein product [Pleuronectes platessa]|uniref:Uncharacterized protein n=1 Tax=Pleuronectes platessa TaxID=8262 RepID=A0A9N7UJF6_PLEPL|nr:unnamed protein product [Pleuronectes platessa]